MFFFHIWHKRRFQRLNIPGMFPFHLCSAWTHEWSVVIKNANFVEHPVAGWSRGIGITNAGITSDGWSREEWCGLTKEWNGVQNCAGTSRTKAEELQRKCQDNWVRLLTHLVIKHSQKDWKLVRAEATKRCPHGISVARAGGANYTGIALWVIISDEWFQLGFLNKIEERATTAGGRQSVFMKARSLLLYHPTAQWGQPLGILGKWGRSYSITGGCFRPRPKPTNTLSEEVSSLWRFCRQSGARTIDVYAYLCHLRDSGASAAAELSWSTFSAEK